MARFASLPGFKEHTPYELANQWATYLEAEVTV